jgi:hypothetical protein
VTAGGWVFMILAWGFVLGLAGYCIVKTLREG